MEYFPFAFTVFFLLLGPKTLLPAFSGLMRGADLQFKRSVAVRGTLVAAALCAFVVAAAGVLLCKYRISIDAVRIAGGLVLLISALKTIFGTGHAAEPHAGTATAMQIAVSPVAIPLIVPPAGIAALLMFALFSSQIPGMLLAMAISLTIIMMLNFLGMYFIDQITKAQGLMLGLKVIGSVLVFMQAGLAIEMMLTALKSLGVIAG